MQVPGLQFGSGVVLAAPQTTSGNPATDPTPLILGVLQNVKLTLGADIKELFGQSQWAVDTAVGKRTIKGTFEIAQISNLLMSQLFFADPTTAGTLVGPTYPGELWAIPTTPFEVTVTNAAHFVADLGVTYQATGVGFVDVGAGSLTAAGQYKVNLSTGVYTFYSADAAAEVLINYTYSQTTAGNTLAVQNHFMGWGPVVSLNIWFPYESSSTLGIGFYLPNVRLGKIDAATKIDDYAMYTIDYQAFAGAAGNPFTSYQLF